MLTLAAFIEGIEGLSFSLVVDTPHGVRGNVYTSILGKKDTCGMDSLNGCQKKRKKKGVRNGRYITSTLEVVHVTCTARFTFTF